MAHHQIFKHGAYRAMQIYICIALIFLYSVRTYSQESVDQDSVSMQAILSLYEQGEFEKAVEKMDASVPKFIKNKKWKDIFSCQDILIEIEDLDTLNESLIPKLEYLHSQIPDIYENEIAYSAQYIGYIEDGRGNIINALKYYLESASIYNGIKNLKNLSQTYSELGLIYTKLGDYARAKKLLKASAAIELRRGDYYQYGYNLFRLSAANFYNNELEESEKRLLEFFKYVPTDDCEFYYELSTIKIEQHKIDSARYYFLKAKQLCSQDQYSEVDFNGLYSDILLKEGNVGAAINFLKRNEAAIFPLKNKREKAKHFESLAGLYASNGDWKNAILNYNEALKNFTNQIISVENLDDLARNKNLYSEIWIGDILIAISKAYKAQIGTRKDEEKRKRIKKCIHFALESLDYKRSLFEEIQSSTLANKKSKGLYEAAIDIYLSWYEQDENIEDLNLAFEIAQRHNAFILRQQINERLILEKCNVIDSLKNQYLEQKIKVLELSLLLNKNYSQKEFILFMIEEEKLDSLTRLIETQHPQFEKLKNNFSITSLQDIQSTLDKKSAVIKYFEGSEKLYAFVIDKKKAKCFVHENIGKIKEQVSEIRSILSNTKSKLIQKDSIEQVFLNSSYELYKNILVEEINFLPKKVNSLTIIPTGVLKQIPFEPLVTDEKESWNTPDNYLIHDYSISYNYFCRALTEVETNSELNKVLTYGLEYDKYTLTATKKISNDSISKQIIDKFRSEEMGHLYSADDEAMEVAEIFDGTSYTNENATKDNFLTNVNAFDVVHLSAHSFVDMQYPSNSSIIFTKKDSLTDNLLQIKDVDRLTLNGQLFTLSACNTFFGKNEEGEGLSSMARSFIQSGAGSVIGSFWSVPDEISKSFMVHFYAKLKDGMTKDEALRATKIDFMTDDNLSSPLYRSPANWSAWVIYGDSQSITKPKKWMIYVGFGAFLFSILCFMFFRNRRVYT